MRKIRPLRFMTDIEQRMAFYLKELGLEEGQDFLFNVSLPVYGGETYKIPDFLFPEKKLIIECDGAYWHKNRWKDEFRDILLESKGYKTVRFTDKEIMKEPIETMKRLKMELCN